MTVDGNGEFPLKLAGSTDKNSMCAALSCDNIASRTLELPIAEDSFIVIRVCEKCRIKFEEPGADTR